MKVTGGVRDKDGNATDAGVVAQREPRHDHAAVPSPTTSINDSTVVVGIGGVFGREGAELYILDNRIENNGWDGVALYRGATAMIADNVIRTGRGAGVGITWDAHGHGAAQRRQRYWKGIGSFGNTRVVARNNRVHHNLGWGMVASGQRRSWTPPTTRSCATATAAWRSGAIRSRGASPTTWCIMNGWRKQWVCPCVGVWDYGQPKGFAVTNNLVFANEAGELQGGGVRPRQAGARVRSDRDSSAISQWIHCSPTRCSIVCVPDSP